MNVGNSKTCDECVARAKAILENNKAKLCLPVDCYVADKPENDSNIEHVALNGLLGRTRQVALVVVAQDGHVAKGLREPVVGIGTQDAHLTAVGAVSRSVGITGNVLGIGVERHQCAVSYLNHTVILVPHLIQAPE